MSRRTLLGCVLALAAAGASLESCGPSTRFEAVHQNLPGAILSVWGTSERDVYFVGADARDATGPVALHFDGGAWRRLRTGLTAGNLWWVFGAAPGAVYMVGTGGAVLRHDPAAGAFERMATPASTVTLYGIWGAGPSDLWAVGGSETGVAGVLWHYDGTAWEDRTATLPPAAVAGGSIFKVWGAAANDVWAVVANGSILHWDGSAWATSPLPAGVVVSRLLTVHGSGSRRFAVGGFGSGAILEGDGATWTLASVPGLTQLNGVFVPQSGDPIAVGVRGSVFRRAADGWQAVTDPPSTDFDFHAVWVDPSGGAWAVGGDLSSAELGNGMIWHSGRGVAAGPITGP